MPVNSGKAGLKPARRVSSTGIHGDACLYALRRPWRCDHAHPCPAPRPCCVFSGAAPSLLLMPSNVEGEGGGGQWWRGEGGRGEKGEPKEVSSMLRTNAAIEYPHPSITHSINQSLAQSLFPTSRTSHPPSPSSRRLWAAHGHNNDHDHDAFGCVVRCANCHAGVRPGAAVLHHVQR